VAKLREQEGRPTLKINPASAKERGIEADEWIEAYNERGAVRFWAQLTDDVPPGVAVAEGVWWTKHTPDSRSVNVLTSDRLTDMGWGSTLHDNRVSIRKLT
jgi:anaerobic selenocysteine-containing dehydrogenase